jgi:hypothetical protein
MFVLGYGNEMKDKTPALNGETLLVFASFSSASFCQHPSSPVNEWVKCLIYVAKIWVFSVPRGPCAEGLTQHRHCWKGWTSSSPFCLPSFLASIGAAGFSNTSSSLRRGPVLPKAASLREHVPESLHASGQIKASLIFPSNQSLEYAWKRIFQSDTFSCHDFSSPFTNTLWGHSHRFLLPFYRGRKAKQSD